MHFCLLLGLPPGFIKRTLLVEAAIVGMASEPSDLAKGSSNATLRAGMEQVAQQQVKIERKSSEDKLKAELEVGLC